MLTGELKLLLQLERKRETVHQPEHERDNPAPLHLRTDDVLERDIQNRNRDERFDERRKPQRVRTEAESGRDQGDRMRDREAGDDHRKRHDAPERDHETEQKEQMVGAGEYVQEAGLD